MTSKASIVSATGDCAPAGGRQRRGASGAQPSRTSSCGAARSARYTRRTSRRVLELQRLTDGIGGQPEPDAAATCAASPALCDGADSPGLTWLSKGIATAALAVC